MKKLTGLVLIVFILLSCNSELIQFHAKDFKNVSIKPGSTFSIVLPEDHANGQNWTMISAGDTDVLEYKGSSYRGSKSGLTDFIFESIKTGETNVSFKLVEYSHPIDTAIVTVKVQ